MTDPSITAQLTVYRAGIVPMGAEIVCKQCHQKLHEGYSYRIDMDGQPLCYTDEEHLHGTPTTVRSD